MRLALLLLLLSAPAFADPPATGKEACALALPKPETLFPRAKLDGRVLAHGAVCAYAEGTNRAVVIVACPTVASSQNDGEWSDLDDGVSGRLALGSPAAFVQRFDGHCVITVQTTGAWLKLARDAAKAVQATPPAPPADEPRLAISITATGKLFLGGVAIESSALPAALAKLAVAHKGAQIVIEADRNVSHATVVTVMEQAKAAGFTRLAIATAPGP